MKPDAEVTAAEVQIASIDLLQDDSLDPEHAAQKTENFGALNKNGRKTGGSSATGRGGKGTNRFQDMDLALLRELGMQMQGLPPSPRPGPAKKPGRHTGNGHAGNGHAGNGHSGNGHCRNGD